jgi:hypothetical protein
MRNINKRLLPSNKKAIPGASWDGSRFLSRSATATYCKLSTPYPTPVLKIKASIRLESNFQ